MKKEEGVGSQNMRKKAKKDIVGFRMKHDGEKRGQEEKRLVISKEQNKKRVTKRRIRLGSGQKGEKLRENKRTDVERGREKRTKDSGAPNL